MPAALRENTVLVSVADEGAAFHRGTITNNATHVVVAYGTPMSDVKAAVLAANPAARVVEVTAPHLRRLCRWLGSTEKQKAFNKLTRYVLTESSRYCPNEDHGGYGAPGFNWQNPFTAYNCTWGFRAPAEYPEERACGAHDLATAVAKGGLKGPETAAELEPALEERSNSTTCPRQMLCDHNVNPDGRVTREITRCNIEGYNGLAPRFKPDRTLTLTLTATVAPNPYAHPNPNPNPNPLILTLALTLTPTLTATRFKPIADAMLRQMPGGRCPYPPLDVPGPGPGFDRMAHWVGL